MTEIRITQKPGTTVSMSTWCQIEGHLLRYLRKHGLHVSLEVEVGDEDTWEDDE